MTLTPAADGNPRGPYDTELEVLAATGQRDWDTDTYKARNRERLHEAITRTGVQVGNYDQRILDWLAGFCEPQTVEVIAALIDRAGAPVDAT